MKSKREKNSQYLLCEHRSIFFMLMLTSGIMGAYTYTQRGGVFCNAQTANILMMSVAIGQARWRKAFYFIVPITAYALGAFVSEILPSPIKNHWKLRWETCLIGAEMLILLLIGFVPQTVSDRVVQVVVNFIASMQYNTFRQAEGIPMATTFCTNHVRQIGVALAKVCRKHDKAALQRFVVHAQMIAGFICGAAAASLIGKYLHERSVWAALFPLMIIFISLIHADFVTEKAELHRKPSGH